jgi:hypothetical protein
MILKIISSSGEASSGAVLGETEAISNKTLVNQDKNCQFIACQSINNE